MSDAIKVLFEVAIEKCWVEGARAERERVAIRQAMADECPPGCPSALCTDVKVVYECKKCWQEWLEADE